MIAASASADTPRRIELEPVGAADFITIGVGAALIAASNIIHPISAQPAGQNGFDEAARGRVRLDNLTARFAIRDASDLTLGLLLLAPLLGDALINVAWYRKSPDAGWRMAVVDLETYAITGALQGITSMLASRERPYGRTCGGETPGEAYDCVSQARYRSFYSGHAAFAFTGAALTCSQHVRYELFGGGAAEAATCAAAFTVAATTALFRMMGDMHYATDVLTGAALGTLVGFLVPWLHERTWRQRTPIGTVQVRLAPAGQGLGVSGTW